MIRSIAVLVLFLSTAISYAGPSAPSAFVPVPALKAVLEAELNPISTATVSAYATAAVQGPVFTNRSGMNEALAAKANTDTTKTFVIGDGFAVNVSPANLLPTSYFDGTTWIHLGTVTSVDALGMRLQFDLGTLDTGDQLWIIDPTVNRAHGPYTSADNVQGGRWLPSVTGDTAVVMVQSPNPAKPAATLLAVSHFFIDLDAAMKLLGCNVNIACETDPVLLEAATAVGVLVIQLGLNTGLCSGCLINNAITTEKEPFFITANHCISSGNEAQNSEVRFDYRAETCGSNDAPNFASLPSAEGTGMLATNDNLDITLIRLNRVPAGAFGRSLVGWDTRTPVVDENLVGIHHPGGSHMRINHGRVTRVGVRALSYQNQTEVVWDTGVTEGGSSGSPLLFEADALYLGALSNGLQHECGPDRSGNLDDYSAFRLFYAEIAEYIDSATPPGPNVGGSPCPAKAAFGNAPTILKNLRAFRDRGLSLFGLGESIVDGYYDAAPTIADSVEKSETARNAFMAISAPFITLGEKLEKNNR
jgi:hypothetical protein